VSPTVPGKGKFLGYDLAFPSHSRSRKERARKRDDMPTSAAKAVKMNKKETEKYRRLLLEKKAMLSSDLAKTRNAEEETSDESTQDIADKAVSSYTREFLYSLSDNDRNTLLLIDQALGRIDDGIFGACLNCGVAMSEKRLMAVPWAPHCVDCQELAEKGLLES
jgi:DnaK suppressor protein